MGRKLASVQKVVNIRPIEGADAIEVATVQGWDVVVAKKDAFKVGDNVVYIETIQLCQRNRNTNFFVNVGFAYAQ
jgi:hypothetical protein